jgi:ElaB/YqjD/DUF883 family membrane-anchored ribosome-binding protein
VKAAANLGATIHTGLEGHNMKKNKAAAHTPEEILEELRALVKEAEAIVGDSVTGYTDDVVNALKAKYEAAQTRLFDAYDRAKTQTLSAASTADAAVREHPYGSLAIAAGAGLLVGMLVATRNTNSSARA